MLSSYLGAFCGLTEGPILFSSKILSISPRSGRIIPIQWQCHFGKNMDPNEMRYEIISMYFFCFFTKEKQAFLDSTNYK